MSYKLTKWQWSDDVREEELRAEMRSQKLAPFSWHNGPHDAYSPHTRSYTRVIYIVKGSAVFHFPADNEDVAVTPGDRLEIPARTLHGFTAGPEGVTCLEAAIRQRGG